MSVFCAEVMSPELSELPSEVSRLAKLVASSEELLSSASLEELDVPDDEELELEPDELSELVSVS